jgi:hypothetical protein
MAGGWNRRNLFELASSRCLVAAYRSPSSKLGILPSSRQRDKTMSIATASDFEMAPARPLVTPLLLALACVALADWLFYGWPIGISLALFLQCSASPLSPATARMRRVKPKSS